MSMFVCTVTPKGVCRDETANCVGGSGCVHDIYRLLSCAAMRAGAEFRCRSLPHEQLICKRVREALGTKLSLEQLAVGGLTPEMLAYAGCTLSDLLARQSTPLERAIRALDLSFDDLLLLGFKFVNLSNKATYPLIVLYDLCGVRALHLLSFEIGFSDLQKHVLDVDARYEKLLNLNLPWWYRALAGSEKSVKK